MPLMLRSTARKSGDEISSASDTDPHMKLSKIAAALLISAVAACSPGSSGDKAAADTVKTGAQVVTATRVNGGTHGMAARTHWLLSPDSSSVIVVSDPAGVEAEPVPNGFFFGSETSNFQTQVDSVWDVAVSPDWKTIAFGKAYGVRGSEQDTSAPATAWRDLAERTGLDSATVRSASFASSGMSYARAISQAGIVRVPPDARQAGAADSARPKMFPIPRGWRVRWTSDGSIVALGNNPARAQDDEMSETWIALDPRTGTTHTSLPANPQLIQPKWVQGPTLDISIPLDMTKASPLFVKRDGRNYTIESVRGVITLRESGVTGGGIAIGPGIALAATRTGRFIVAISPRLTPAANELPIEPIVYSVSR